MDLVAQPCDRDLVRLIPNTIVGVLWLQTHFADDEWDALLSGQAAFDVNCMTHIADDARLAGLNVEWEAQVPS